MPGGIDDGLITSGDVTRALIAANRGRPFFHIGPKRDLPLFAGLNVQLTDPDKAEMVILTGLYDDDRETPQDYRERLERLLRRHLPMICANPDIKVQRGDKVIYAAGAIARLYEEMGGEVVQAGKPFRPIYDLARARINELAGREISPARILAIGDGVNTDIKGAVENGMDALFVPSAVHAREGEISPRELAAIFANGNFAPLAAIPALRW